MNAKLTIKRAPSTEDKRVPVGSLPTNSVFVIESLTSNTPIPYLTLQHAGNIYTNNKALQDAGKQLCAELASGRLCYVDSSMLVSPTPATLLLPAN